MFLELNTAVKHNNYIIHSEWISWSGLPKQIYKTDGKYAVPAS